MKFQPIERRTGLTREEFIEEYEKKQKPVIFTDLAKDWPATKKWTFDYFKSNYGDMKVPVYGNSFRDGGKDYMKAVKELPFREYLETIEAGPTELRMFLFNIFKNAPELAKDIPIPTITDGFLKEFPMMFFGGQDAYVDLHYDLDCANVFLTQFQTRKRVILFSPDQGDYLYHHPFTVQSYVRPDQPDFKQHPAFQYAKGYEGTISHGETVYMPSLWWHFIYYTDGGYSVALRTHSLYTRLRGGYNIARHFMIDHGMNRLFGKKWKEIKENIAAKNAKAAMEREHSV